MVVGLIFAALFLIGLGYQMAEFRRSRALRSKLQELLGENGEAPYLAENGVLFCRRRGRTVSIKITEHEEIWSLEELRVRLSKAPSLESSPRAPGSRFRRLTVDGEELVAFLALRAPRASEVIAHIDELCRLADRLDPAGVRPRLGGAPGGARSKASMKALRCPFCREDFSAEDGVPCPSCGTCHHAECYEESGGCTVLGCRSAPALRARDASR